MNEFKEALEKLNGCIGTISCGCSMTSDEGLYADSLYYRCHAYIKAYELATYSKPLNRNK